MLTTSLSKPVAMDIAKADMPLDDFREPWPASRTMTLLLGSNNKVGYYFGESDHAKPDIAPYSEIRKIILKYKVLVAKANKNNPRKTLQIIVKPLPESNYKNFVDIMDELNLAGIKSAPAIDDKNISYLERSF